MRVKLSICLLVFTCGLQAEEQANPLELELLQEKRTAAVRAIDMSFKTELEKLRTAFTKRGDLEDANRVDTILKAMAKPKPLGEPFGDVAGEWRVQYSNKAGRVYTIDAKGNVTDGNGKKADLQPISEGFLLDYGSHSFERLTFRKERMFIEHWNPKSGFEEGVQPTHFGIGSRSVKP